MKLLRFSKRFCAVLMAVAIITPSFAYLTVPQKAEATIVEDIMDFFATDIPHWLEAILQTAYQGVILEETTISAIANDWLSFLKEADLDGVMWALKQMIIIEVTNMMMEFINNGFQGGPAYIEDPGLHYYNISDDLTQVYLGRLEGIAENVGAGSLTEYILTETVQLLEEEEYRELEQKLTPLPEDEFPGGYAAFEEFIEDPATCPTGNSYDCMLVLLEEKNDFFSEYTTARDELDKQRSEGLSHAYQEVSSSNQFHTFKRCAEYVARGNAQTCARYITTLPGRVVTDQLQYYLQSQMNELHQADEIDELIAGVLFDLATDWIGNSQIEDYDGDMFGDTPND